MTLRERLEAAKAERRQRAGLPPEAPEVSPMQRPIGSSPTDEDARSDDTIDLTGYAPVVDLRQELLHRDTGPSFSGALVVSEGNDCPNCGSVGQVDMEDVVGGVDHYSCTNCGLLYQVAR
jgi:hypothetical protein